MTNQTSIKSIALVFLLIAFFACSRKEMIDKNGEISNELKKDPLFESMDKAYSLHLADMMKYPRDKINPTANKKIKRDLQLNKFKNVTDYAKAKEKAGYIDFEQRIRNLITFKAAEERLFQKYPELKSNKKKFYKYFLKNKRYVISNENTKELLLQRKKYKQKNF